ncbi:hypothetical protein Tco_1381226 [Tanacetum coccineum]
MILNSLQNGPLIWPTVVEEDGTTRTKKYEELSIAEKLQANCDLKATNIVLQCTKLSLQEKECKLYDEFDKFSFVKGKTLYHLPPEWSKFMMDVKLARDLHTTNYDQFHSSVPPSQQYQSHQTSSVPPIAYNTPQSLTQPLTEFPQMDLGLVVPVFNQGDDPIAYKEQLAFLIDPGIPDGKAIQTTIPNTVAFQTEDLDAYDSDCDDVSNAKAILMSNLSNYGSDIISEETDIQEKDKNKAKNEKTEHENEKNV